jgi:hypothetical protein
VRGSVGNITVVRLGDRVSVVRSLQLVSGVVAVMAGGAQAVTGLAGTAGMRAAPPQPGSGLANVDSELRFYGTWYAASGLLTLEQARRGRPLHPMHAAAWVVAGLARRRGTKAGVEPQRLFRMLGAAEIALGVILLAERTRA